MSVQTDWRSVSSAVWLPHLCVRDCVGEWCGHFRGQWQACVRVSVRSAVGQFVRVADGRVQRQGVGVHYSLDGSVFSGSWIEDKMNGQGECIHSNGIKYKVLIGWSGVGSACVLVHWAIHGVVLAIGRLCGQLLPW